MLWVLSSAQGDGCMLLRQHLCSQKALSCLLGDFPVKWGEGLRLQLPVNGSELQVPVSCGPSRSPRRGESEAAHRPAPMAGPLSSPGGERTPSHRFHRCDEHVDTEASLRFPKLALYSPGSVSESPPTEKSILKYLEFPILAGLAKSQIPRS